ncbi:U32 family peptidase [Myxococcota bacterium]|nr:U32 family peptidase [Myxococcota bacterium]
MLRLPSLVVPVHGPAALAAAVRYGADNVTIRGWPSRPSDSSVVERGGFLPGFRPEDVAAAVEFCASRSIGVRVPIQGALTSGGIQAALDLAGGFIEVGVGTFVVSDPGLAIAIGHSFPDAVLLAGEGMMVGSVATAHAIRNLGFKGIVAPSGVGLATIADIRRETDLGVEVSLFGARPVALCHICSLSQYFMGVPCEGPTFGVCRGPFDAAAISPGMEAALAAGARSRWLDMRFYSALAALPALLQAGVDSVTIDTDRRSSGAVRLLVRVFRSALDSAGASAFDGTAFRLREAWLADIRRASMHDVVTPGFFGDAANWRGDEPESVVFLAARAFEPVITDIESDSEDGVR